MYIRTQRALAVGVSERVVEECKDMTPEEVEKCIDESVLVDTVPLEPGFTNSLEVIEGASEEDYVSGEGIVFYDVKTCLHLPNGKEYIKIIIDVEAQKNDNPGYSIPLRALYYCSRQVSSQLGVEFTNKTGDKIKYDGLKKYTPSGFVQKQQSLRQIRLSGTELARKCFMGKDAVIQDMILWKHLLLTLGRYIILHFVTMR